MYQKYLTPVIISVLSAIILYLLADTFLPKSPEETPTKPVTTVVSLPETSSGSDDLILPPLEDVGTGETVMCTADYTPVCGADNKTYSNACTAESLGVTVASPGECKKPETLPSVPTETSATESAPPSTLSGEIPLFSSGTYHLYENAGLEYGFALPKFVYYQGYGVQDGSNHSMAIALTSTGVDDFSTAPVRVYFYKKGNSPQVAGTVVSVENGTIVIAPTGTESKISTIVDIIEKSAH